MLIVLRSPARALQVILDRICPLLVSLMTSTDAFRERELKRKRSTGAQANGAPSQKQDQNSSSRKRRRTQDDAQSNRGEIDQTVLPLKKPGSKTTPKPVQPDEYSTLQDSSRPKPRKDRKRNRGTKKEKASAISPDDVQTPAGAVIVASSKLAPSKTQSKTGLSNKLVEKSDSQSADGRHWTISTPMGGRFIDAPPLLSRDEK